MTVLLDSNVLIALTVSDHVHHDLVEEWFASLADEHATCPITQGALLRLVLRNGVSAADGQALIAGIARHERHRFWPDDIGHDGVSLTGVVGHRQVTDAYLAALARHNAGRLATLDGGLAGLHPDVTDLIDG